MVEILTDEELKNLRTSKAHFSRIRLTPEQIQEWKEKGHFKHIKKELESIPNVKFGCMQLNNGCCVYCFTFPSSELVYRFSRMLAGLMDNQHTRLVQLSNKETDYFGLGSFTGTPKACNLF